MKQGILGLLAVLAAGSAAAAVVDPITVVDTGSERILANADHLTLYTYDRDSNGVSACYDGCPKAWPAVLVNAQDQVQAPLGLTVRNDGSHQLTVNGKPVYLYVGDEKEGDANGDGLGGIWHVIPASAVPGSL